MERAKKELVTLSGKKVVIKDYLSAREMQDINLSVVGDRQTDGEGGKIQMPLASGVAWEKKVFQAAILSVDENITDPTEILLDLSNEEYGDIKAKIYEHLKINLKQAK